LLCPPTFEEKNLVSYRISSASAAFLGFVCASFGQQAPPVDPPIQEIAREGPHSVERKRIFLIIPNYRTSPSLENYHPLTAGEKFRIASEDTLDRGTITLGAILGAEGQLTNSNRTFGQGAEGYSRYFGAAYGDLFVGNYMTEAVFPTLLHQDPRYFRRGTGSGWARLGYSMSQIVLTRSDSGSRQFNYSEVVGNSAAVAISNAWYADNRNAGSAASQLGMQIGFDMAGNILKEFWPDLERRFSRKNHEKKPLNGNR
jgi:hypothetical protein